jgi:hypothetical protein
MSEETQDTAEETQNATKDKTDETSETTTAGKIPSLYHNYVSFAGTAIAVAAITCIVLLFLLEITGEAHNPYLELFTYILFPSILVFGLFIILVGILFERRRRRKLSPEEIAAFPVLDLNDPRRRRILVAFLCLSMIFLFVSAFGSYRAFEYSESVSFCGTQCHVPMKPEFIAHGVAPHSQIRCVECHVGGGSEGYVRAKMGGMRQLYRVITDTYDKPITTPVHNMPAVAETCAKCHWTEKFHGDVLKVFNHFGYDEKNSLSQARMLIKVGGGSPETGPVSGIHWHMNLANEITYIATDEKRQSIPWVRIKDRSGKVTEYTTKDAQLSPQQIEQTPKRRMDCIDCHNRPTHIYLPPDKAVDNSFVANKLDATLPYLKLKAVEVLSKPYNTTDEAVQTISADLSEYYRTNYADIYSSKKDSIDGAITEIQRIYQTNFFPEMKTDWRTHADNIGHYKVQGCFRCHDGQHFSGEGKVIRNECSVCHTTIDQTFEGKTILPREGIFQHPVNLGDKGNWQCAVCHKADRAFKHPLNLGDISRFQCAECHKE